MSMLHSLSDCQWFQVLRKWMFGRVQGPLGLENIILRTSDHGVISLWIGILNVSISSIWSNSEWERSRRIVTWCWSESQGCLLRWRGWLDRCRSECEWVCKMVLLVCAIGKVILSPTMSWSWPWYEFVMWRLSRSLVIWWVAPKSMIRSVGTC